MLAILLGAVATRAWTEYLFRASTAPWHYYLAIAACCAAGAAWVRQRSSSFPVGWQVAGVGLAITSGSWNWLAETSQLHRDAWLLTSVFGGVALIPACIFTCSTSRRRISAMLVACLLAWGAFAATHIDFEGLDGQGLLVMRLSPPGRASSGDTAAPPTDRSAPTDLDSAYFPAFRFDGSGVVPERRFSERPTFVEQWRVPIGAGWGGLVTADGRVFAHSQDDHRAWTRCLALATGKTLWEVSRPHEFERPLSGPGPRATPALSGQDLVTLGADGVLECRGQADGSLRWRRAILDDAAAENTMHGAVASPLIVDQSVIVTAGGSLGAVTAYSLATGVTQWQTGDDLAGYSSPMLMTVAGERLIVVLHRHTVAAYSLDGQRRWSHSYENVDGTNAVQPLLAGESQLVLTSGYGRLAELLDLTVTPAQVVWSAKRPQTKFSSGVIRDRRLFALDNGVLCCVNLENGAMLWKCGRYGHGQLLLAGDVVVVQCESGEIAMVAATDTQWRELLRRPALDRRTWNTPCLAGNWLLLRNDLEAACFRLE